MIYQSTRSDYTTDSLHAVLNGLAPDGGLFVRQNITGNAFNWQECLNRSSTDMAKMLLKNFFPDFQDIDSIVDKSYRNKFETEDLTPLVPVKNGYILELFRGPTSAFKDVALSVLPHLIVQAKKQTDTKGDIVILTATSGDTGKAALEGFHDVEGTQIVVFYPNDGVSEIQKKQMTSQIGKNVSVCAVNGNFDDCQTGVKKAFANLREKLFANGKILSSANSINIGRLVPQITYYFIAYKKLVRLGKIKIGEPVNFSVPTGNFGDILAGYYAKLSGLPVGKLICASNSNNVLTDFLKSGVYDKNRNLIKSMSPSMDILVSSNLERLLFHASGNNTEAVKNWMQNLNSNGYFKVDSSTLSAIQQTFEAGFCSEEDTLNAIRNCWKENGYLCDTHTAVAYHVAMQSEALGKSNNPCVILSTASPYKFPNAVLTALEEPVSDDEFDMMQHIRKITGVEIPANLSSLKDRKPVHNDVIDVSQIEHYVTEAVNGNSMS